MLLFLSVVSFGCKGRDGFVGLIVGGFDGIFGWVLGLSDGGFVG